MNIFIFVVYLFYEQIINQLNQRISISRYLILIMVIDQNPTMKDKEYLEICYTIINILFQNNNNDIFFLSYLNTQFYHKIEKLS